MLEHDDLLQEENAEELYEKKTFIIDKGQEPLRIDKWMHARIENATRNKIQKGIDAGFLTVNGRAVKSNYRVKPDDKIVWITLINPEFSEIVPENIPLDFVYEDDAVMVINKPPNMVVHPGVGNYTGTLLNGVAYHLQQQNPDLNEEDLPRFGLVHRIDKNTTGLIVLAKTGEAASNLAKQFFNHTVTRKYIAVVWGNVEEDEGTIIGNIGRHERFRKMFTVYPEGDKGKHAVTHYKVLERLNYVTVVECVLETGRTHQIRVHMKSIGHTLFNDWEYGGDKILKGTVYTKYKQFVDNCFEVCPRCALHAKTLGFDHPVTDERMFFDSPLPNDMQQLIEKWERYIQFKPLPEE
ncbi:RNA pseudouridine synthase [Arachidicoccus ginsenosidimutans]|uniref:RluA family pseudouridine synthase n=1 Tax=Arachidicoccus sp. BS20 TaxID=1850526 RepID=UPI0007F174E6|nr:RluA family pseudouridine synthase [Arachidicoccus sp. BS20]ANI90371.1 RNA pseudouridine synthase [Arachidicoccus sp. BS20]